jgi:hypothetical protein
MTWRSALTLGGQTLERWASLVIKFFDKWFQSYVAKFHFYSWFWKRLRFRIWPIAGGQAPHMGRYYCESRLCIPSMVCLTQEGVELWSFEFKNLKNIIMKYRATIGVVNVVYVRMCPVIGGVFMYQVWRIWDLRGRSYEEKFLRVFNLIIMCWKT